ncbi:MAG: DNA polymerase III subunit alpha [Candidatus Aminicenantes bacterium]|nr:DNA polymerase III subunit alpha [Candidatus Aminicenantes bacterium]
MESSFIHLHNHTEYSILDGALRLEDLVEAAFQANMPAVAITDHGNIFGAVAFFKLAKARGLKPILGCEVYLAPKSRFDRSTDEAHNYHLVLLVKDSRGYRNLCHLITNSYLEGFYYKPRIDKEILAQHSQGLIGLSSCLKGEIAVHLLRGEEKEAEEVAAAYASIFGPGNFYLELMDHGLPQQREVNRGLIRLSKKLGLPLVATNDIHYLRQEDAATHDVLLCIQTNKKLSDPDRLRFGSTEFYFKSPAQMARLFGEVPEALENTFKIAAQCQFDFPLGSHFLPRYIPSDGSPLEEFFDRVAWEGFARRKEFLFEKQRRGELSHPISTYEERLKKEIALVKQMGFEGYFLIVWDLISMARSKGIPVGPGRGSAAGSLLAYCLGITDIDPIEYDLLFERFLNPERITLPDIDIDFCGRRRDEVIEYVTQKYGRENVCQIITFGTMAARQAIRDVGRVLEIPLPEVDRIAKMIPAFGPESTIDGAIKSIPQLKELYERNAKIAQLLNIARSLEGQVRHPSIHAAGIVIAPKPLVEFMPLYMSSKNEITTQFPMEDIEAIGLLKMDLLGLRNLTVIRDTIDLVARDLNQRIDIEKISLEDQKTFELFQKGATDGVFQFESPGMKDLLRSFKPETFRDLIALNALYRPGPLKSGMTEEFVRRKKEPNREIYEIPELEPILKETRGIIVYQEQVMRIATELAGFTMAEADVLRKAMGKKDTEAMKTQRQKFIQGARKKGLNQAQAVKIFDQIRHFAEYGFNKSHSAAYAYLAFQTAYLKAHYPAHFMAALLTSEAERGATSQVVKYFNECHNMGLEVLPPDINFSNSHFTVNGQTIRFGLAAIKNVGEAAVKEILAARNRRGRFRSPFEVVEGVDMKLVNRKVLESLVKAGAFDSLGWKRSQCYHLIDLMIEYGHKVQKLKEAPQTSLFQVEEILPPEIPPEVLEMKEWDESLLLSYEKDVLGFYITGHPLSQFQKKLRRLVSHFLSELDEIENGLNEIKVTGIVTSVKALKTKKEERMATFILEDMTGRAEVVAFPDAFQQYQELLHEGQLLWLKARILGDQESRRLQLLQAMPLPEALEKLARCLILRLFVPGLETSSMEELKNLLLEYPGECPVIFDLEIPYNCRVRIQSREIIGIKPVESLTRRLEALLGEDSVILEY